jgi:hypothetical protein
MEVSLKNILLGDLFSILKFHKNNYGFKIIQCIMKYKYVSSSEALSCVLFSLYTKPALPLIYMKVLQNIVLRKILRPET